MKKYEEIGKILKERREIRKLSIDEVCNVIKIRRQYISALELGDISEIPGEAYITGYLKIYSEFLGVYDDINDILSKADPEPLKRKKFHKIQINKTLNRKSLLMNIIIILSLILIILLVLSNRTSDANQSISEYILEDD